MTCPIHRIRQLDDSLFCRDCGKHWTQKQLDTYQRLIIPIETEKVNAIVKAGEEFEKKRNALLKQLLEVSS